MRPSEQNLKEGLLEDAGESFQAEALSPGDGSKLKRREVFFKIKNYIKFLKILN